MGLLDRFAKRVAEEMNKAPVIRPESAYPVNQSAIMSSNTQSYASTPLERNNILASAPFPSGLPLYPNAINPLRPDGRPDPRRWEFLVAQNINLFENRLVPFKTLRIAADQIDILRKCIEVRKAKLTGLKWDIVLSDSASEKIISDAGGDHIRAMAKAREQYAPEIARIRSFWETPDPQNGLSWRDWFGMAVEEIDVLDALAIWPQKKINGDIRGLQILDGSTIKPIIDDRGMRPDPSVGPAYQQILYGFPRSEFHATVDDENADGDFTSDELAYFVRNRRSFSIWGYSPTERALPVADIYLRRQQWLKAEFTDGVLPKTWLELPDSAQLTPEQIKAYENIFNDDLTGQTEQRNRMRFLLPGGKLQFEAGYSEKFSDRLDDYLVTQVCGHFGVLPTEIGFSAKTGLGGSGHQQGEMEAAETIGINPTANWFAEQLSNLSYRWLGMPRELEFKFMISDRKDDEALAKRDQIKIISAGITVNERRSEAGLPLLDTPEADMPILVAGQSVFLFTPEGIVAAGTPLDESGAEEPTEAPVEEKPVEPAKEEVKKFLRWMKKSNKRPFNFEHLEPTYAKTLNKFIEINDLDGARWYAETYLGD